MKRLIIILGLCFIVLMLRGTYLWAYSCLLDEQTLNIIPQYQVDIETSEIEFDQEKIVLDFNNFLLPTNPVTSLLGSAGLGQFKYIYAGFINPGEFGKFKWSRAKDTSKGDKVLKLDFSMPDKGNDCFAHIGFCLQEPINTGEYDYLSIDVKANQAIPAGILKVELSNVGNIGSGSDTYKIAEIYIPEITTEWQTIYIPLDKIRNHVGIDSPYWIRACLLNQIAFVLNPGGKSISNASVSIDNLKLLTSKK